MVVGLGHGSTAAYAIQRIGELIRAGELRDILGVPCSKDVEAEARRLRIPLTTLDDHPSVDLTIDGADEVAPNLDLIKGAGAAILREKIVGLASGREVIAVDESKLSPALGTKRPLPVEVVPFGARPEGEFLEGLGAAVRARRSKDGRLYRTDQGNLILDADFGPIADPGELARQLDARPAIVVHGLFLGFASEVIVAGPEGIRQLLPE